MSKQSEALEAYFKENRIRQVEIAQATGAHVTTISNVLAGRSNISTKLALALHDVYGFSLGFLLHGEDSLLPPQSSIREHYFDDKISTSLVKSIISDKIPKGSLPIVVPINSEIGELAAKNAKLEAQVQTLQEENAWLRGLVANQVNK